VVRGRHAIERTHGREWPPRIDVDHTVFDLAQGQSLDRAVGLIAKAVQSHRTTVRNLRIALEQRPTQTHHGVLRDVLSDVEAGVESSAERRYTNDVERAHGLPAAERQVWSGPWRCDNEYGSVRVKVEVDGRLGHAGWSSQQRDGRRDRRHAAGGWLTLRMFWPDVAATPCETAEELSSVFRVRGWQGQVRRCRRSDCAVQT
jgi:very-short-patch-repair endonuclease